MPEISLLLPQVLLPTVQKFMVPETLTMLNMIPSQAHPFPVANWDVLRGSRAIAQPNVPNAEAHIIPRLGRSQQSAGFVYLREKKVFEPTTIHWLRAPGSISSAGYAEQAVLREINDLNVRFDNFAEWCIWQMFTGKLKFDFPEVQADIDYKMPASHLPAPLTGWGTATPQSIVNDLRAWKRTVRRDGRVEADQAFATEVTVQKIFDSFATNTGGVGSLLSDRMRDNYYQTGMFDGFMNLTWTMVESVYDAVGAAYGPDPTDPGEEALFLPDNALLIGNFTLNDPYKMLIGPSADDEAPDMFCGKFSKTWKEKDPSQRQFLLEYNFLPVMQRPEQFLYVSDVTSTIAGG